MNRVALVVLPLGLIACGDPHDRSTDAPPPDSFEHNLSLPNAPLQVSNGTDMVPDLSCLGVPRANPATTVPVAMTIGASEFGHRYVSDAAIPGADISVLAGNDAATVLASGTADTQGLVTLSLAAPQRRIAFLVTSSTVRPSFTYDVLLAPASPQQDFAGMALSNVVAARLPEVLGSPPVPGTGIVAATVRDCRGLTLANFVATASTTPTVATPAMGSRVFYFGDRSELPIRYARQSGRDGRYFLMDVPPPTAYLQVWGFRDANELASRTLTRIAELAIPVIADSASFVEQEPHAAD